MEWNNLSTNYYIKYVAGDRVQHSLEVLGHWSLRVSIWSQVAGTIQRGTLPTTLKSITYTVTPYYRKDYFKTLKTFIDIKNGPKHFFSWGFLNLHLLFSLWLCPRTQPNVYIIQYNIYLTRQSLYFATMSVIVEEWVWWVEWGIVF